MKITKKILLSIICIFFSLLIFSSNWIQTVGETKIEWAETSAILTVYEGQLNTYIPESSKIINTIKDGKLSPKEAKEVSSIVFQHRDDMNNLATLVGDISGESNTISNITTIASAYNFLYSITIATGIVCIIACLIWNNKGFGGIFLFLQILISASLLILCVVLNDKDTECRITGFLILSPILAFIAMKNMGDEKQPVFGKVDVSSFEKIKDSINVDSITESLNKVGEVGSKISNSFTGAKQSEFRWECPECGFKNPDENNFCGNCGAKRPEISDDAKRIISNLENSNATLKKEIEELRLQIEARSNTKNEDFEEKYKLLVISYNELDGKYQNLLSTNNVLQNDANLVDELNLKLSEKENEISSIKEELENNKIELNKAQLEQIKFCRFCGHTLE